MLKSPSNTSDVYKTFAQVVDTCGKPDFFQTLLEAIGNLVGWDTCGLIQYSRYSIPTYLISDHVPENEIELYLSGYYRFDPFFRYWRESSVPAVQSLRRFAKNPDTNTENCSDYLDIFQPFTGMADELGVFCPKFGASANNFFFLRETPYREAELEKLDQAFPLILSLHALNQKQVMATLADNHTVDGMVSSSTIFIVVNTSNQVIFKSAGWQGTVSRDLVISDTVDAVLKGNTGDPISFDGGFVFAENLGQDFIVEPEARAIFVVMQPLASGPLDIDQALQALFANRLTPREMSICRLILKGHSTLGISEQLGIGIGTVKNHRKRLYRKLDITTERELFLSILNRAIWL